MLRKIRYHHKPWSETVLLLHLKEAIGRQSSRDNWISLEKHATWIEIQQQLTDKRNKWEQRYATQTLKPNPAFTSFLSRSNETE